MMTKHPSPSPTTLRLHDHSYLWRVVNCEVITQTGAQMDYQVSHLHTICANWICWNVRTDRRRASRQIYWIDGCHQIDGSRVMNVSA